MTSDEQMIAQIDELKEALERVKDTIKKITVVLLYDHEMRLDEIEEVLKLKDNSDEEKPKGGEK